MSSTERWDQVFVSLKSFHSSPNAMQVRIKFQIVESKDIKPNIESTPQPQFINYLS